MSATEIKFRCSLSPIISAIRIGSDTMRLSLDIPRSDIPDAIGMTALEGVVLDAIFKVNTDPLNIKIKEPGNGKVKKEKKPKKERGDWGGFWQKMFRDGSTRDAQFFNHPDLHAALGLIAPVSAEQAKVALREAWGVDSLTFVSPSDFAAWCVANELHSLATMANRIAFE